MAKKAIKGKASQPSSRKDGGPPSPFKRPPEVLQPLIETLDEKHVYITHVDNSPAAFKRKIFLVPVAMNLAVVALFIWRVQYILPYYLQLLASALGYANETTFVAAEMEYRDLFIVIGKRAASFMLDLLLFIFVWPWPVEFVLAQTHSNPVAWRRSVGFQDKEVIVRRSREWDRTIKSGVTKDANAKHLFMAHVNMATAPTVLSQKTGYLTMNSEWDLDWGCMIDAHLMLDKKMAAVEAFKLNVLVFTEDYGWVILDQGQKENAQEDERRRQVFAFRDALAAIGKEDLFFRWIEMIQFEASRPEGFAADKQIEVAQKVRDMFKEQGIEFDEFWKEAVGVETPAGM